MPIPAISHFINTLYIVSSVGEAGVCNQSCMLVKIYIKLQTITDPTFKNFQSNVLSGETLKLCLDLLCNTGITKKIKAKFESFSRKSIWFNIFVSWLSCSLHLYSFVETNLKIQDYWHTPLALLQIIKGIYVMNYSWYEQIIDPMCKASQIINMEEVTYSWGQKRSQISQRGWTKRLRVRVAKNLR